MEKIDKRSITSSENGKLGGRPISLATVARQKMKEELTLAVEKDFKKLYIPQLKKAKKGDFNAYRDLMDRTGIREINKEEGNTFNIAVVLNKFND